MNFTVGSAGFNSQFNGDATGWEVHSGTWWIASSQWYTTQGVSGAWASTSYTANFLNFDYQVRLWRNGCDGCANAILVRGAPEPLSNGDWHSAYAFQYTRDGYYINLEERRRRLECTSRVDIHLGHKQGWRLEHFACCC